MKIAILEIAPHGHYPYVESIMQVFTAVPDNEVVIFTNEKGQQHLQQLVENDSSDNYQVSLIIKQNTEGCDEFFQRIQKFDKIIVVTLEAYAQEPYLMMQAFNKIEFNCPIYYVVHNLDFWFQQSLIDKIKNIFFKLTSFKDFTYRLKVYFYYTLINQSIISKVIQSKGRFVTMTQSMGDLLAKSVGSEHVAIIPFSVFDDKKIHKTPSNIRIRVCIPGFLSKARRDYDAIFKLLDGDSEQFLKTNIEWDFLGGINKAENGQAIKEKAEKYILKGHKIHLYESFISMEKFDNNLSNADIILGNMHLQQGANSIYGKTKETGIIFTMIKAAKPGILPAKYPCDSHLKSSVLTFNNYEDVLGILKHLFNNRNELAILQVKALENAMKFTPLSIYAQLDSFKTTE